MSFSRRYSERIINIVKDRIASKRNLIFVFIGQNSLLDQREFEQEIADIDTFYLNGNEELFNQQWFARVFNVLISEKNFHLISYAQYSYLINYIDVNYFKDRIVIIRDNLRQLFPINQDEYFEELTNESIELRSEKIPIYQAEQMKIGENYFYSVKTMLDDYHVIEMFHDKLILTESIDLKLDVIDITSNNYELDEFLNLCILNDCLDQKVIIKRFQKHPFSKIVEEKLQLINALLSLYGGGFFTIQDNPIEEKVDVNPKIIDLLHRYWGAGTAFRQLKVYSKPDVSKEIVEISQGLIVQKIIDEYEKSREHKSTRDLFLTSSTGSGKSLLFQLPAFYISSNGDLTIVVSPLISLMKDQVNDIITKRKFEKISYLNSELSFIDRQKIIDSCKKGEIDVLYLSPELLLSYDIKHFIGDRRIGLLVVDEAHLITTWGRDFRVDYWFLGNHIRKIRKYQNQNFPMVAVTATAVYGGSNDMVFDSIDSLEMQNPYIYIGRVKRDNITFVINNYIPFNSNYEKNKINQSSEFLKKIYELGFKTLTYVPYSKHVGQIIDKLSIEHPNIASPYHGKLTPQQKDYSFLNFASGRTKIMVATKAFGMGVDIDDIEVVYHHAPSGLLPDYVQEVGRIARRKSIRGIAVMNYCTQDQRFTKALHGMSSLRHFQLKEVLKKIYSAYITNRRRRNLLISVDDFGYIFQNSDSLDQKVLTSLMMIEKDYLIKNRFNVIVARPKKLFVQVFARISNDHYNTFVSTFPGVAEILETAENGQHIIQIDLDKLWISHFSHESFPQLKKKFYEAKIFNGDYIQLVPQLKISFDISHKFEVIYDQLRKSIDGIVQAMLKFNGKYFTEEHFSSALEIHIKDRVLSEKLASFILSSYTGHVSGPGIIDQNAFLQKRKVDDQYRYRVFNTRYNQSFGYIISRFNDLYRHHDSSQVHKYATNREIITVNYIRLGYFLQLLNVGTFEINGGQNPMIFIRINDPVKIENDANSQNYNNSLLSTTLQKHYLSNQIFDHFFLRSLSNDERWEFLEDYFLGAEIDDLINRFPGSDSHSYDIIDEINRNFTALNNQPQDIADAFNQTQFLPSSDQYYADNQLLTIILDGIAKTHRISEWISRDPVALHKNIIQYNLKIAYNSYQILISKIKADHISYYRSILGLKLIIDFRGYRTPVQASLPYSDKPVQFYKWWVEDEKKVFMTSAEKIRLFVKVFSINPRILKDIHRSLINK